MTNKKTSEMTNNKAPSVRRKAGKVNASKTRQRSVSKPPDIDSVGLAQVSTLPHKQIAERATTIWQERGCLPGFDEQNWYEAELQLKSELQAH